MKYEIKVRFPLGLVSPAIAELETSVNKTMEGFGFKDEKMSITSAIELEMTTQREVTEEEKNGMIAIIEKNYSSEFGPSKVESFELMPNIPALPKFV